MPSRHQSRSPLHHHFSFLKPDPHVDLQSHLAQTATSRGRFAPELSLPHQDTSQGIPQTQPPLPVVLVPTDPTPKTSGKENSSPTTELPKPKSALAPKPTLLVPPEKDQAGSSGKHQPQFKPKDPSPAKDPTPDPVSSPSSDSDTRSNSGDEPDSKVFQNLSISPSEDVCSYGELIKQIAMKLGIPHVESKTIPLRVQNSQQWWMSLDNFLQGRPFHPPAPMRILTTDASFSGWGVYMDGLSVCDLWTADEHNLHINILRVAGDSTRCSIIPAIIDGSKSPSLLRQHDGSQLPESPGRHILEDPLQDSYGAMGALSGLQHLSVSLSFSRSQQYRGRHVEQDFQSTTSGS